MAGFLGIAGVVGYRWRGGAPARDSAPDSIPPVPASREEILLAIATLDEGFQASEKQAGEALDQYERQRNHLLGQLRRLS
jgi:hypothetical protein